MVLEFLTEPHELVFRMIYPLFSFIMCLLIYFKTRDIEKLSLNKGVRYFRRAFLFLGLSFPIMFLLMSMRVFIGDDGATGYPGQPPGIPLAMLVSRYFLLASGLYLLYSLVGKRLDSRVAGKEDLAINATALALALSELLVGPLYSTLLSAALFGYITLESYANWRNSSAKKTAVPWYSVSLFLLSLMWLIQLASMLFRGVSPMFRAYTLLSTPAILAIILYLIHKATKEA